MLIKLSRKRQYVLAGALLLLVALINLEISGKTDFVSFPSKEMKQLYGIENSLSLPEPTSRLVDDGGCHKEIKVGIVCTRYIQLSYADGDYWPAIETKLKADGWKIIGTEAWNGSETDPICIRYARPSYYGGNDVGITISGNPDKNCDPSKDYFKF
jgi:hypothetical protein